MNGSYTTILLRGTTGEEWQNKSLALPISYFLVHDAAGGDLVLCPESVSEAPHAPDLIAALIAQAFSPRTVLLAEVKDAEELRLRLWANGCATDEYIAEPGYGTGEELPPYGGDGNRFCAAFGVSAAQTREDLEEVFQAGRYDEFYGFNNAQERHRDIGELLGLSPASIGMDYTNLAQGAIPEGITDTAAIQPVIATVSLQEFGIFAASVETSEAEVAALFLPQVISYDDDYLGEELPLLGTEAQVRRHFVAKGWKTGKDLLLYSEVAGVTLVAELIGTKDECEMVRVWYVGQTGISITAVWDALCREAGWGVWDYRTRRVVYPPAA